MSSQDTTRKELELALKMVNIFCYKRSEDHHLLMNRKEFCENSRIEFDNAVRAHQESLRSPESQKESIKAQREEIRKEIEAHQSRNFTTK